MSISKKLRTLLYILVLGNLYVEMKLFKYVLILKVKMSPISKTHVTLNCLWCVVHVCAMYVCDVLNVCLSIVCVGWVFWVVCAWCEFMVCL